MLDDWKKAGLDFDYDKSIVARNQDVERELSEYRKRMKSHKYSNEEIAEMQSNFGSGEVIVDVLTGSKIRL